MKETWVPMVYTYIYIHTVYMYIYIISKIHGRTQEKTTSYLHLARTNVLEENQLSISDPYKKDWGTAWWVSLV